MSGPAAATGVAAAGSPRSPGRRRLLRGIGGGAALTVGGVGAYGALVGPFRPVVERVEIPVENLPPAFDGFRIAQLTDLHVQPAFPASALRPAFDQVRAERPDLIVLTGDYVNNRQGDTAPHMRACAEAVRTLTGVAPFGIFGVWGNHDYPPPDADPSAEPWKDAGVRFLNDQAHAFMRGTDDLWLIGMRSAIQRPTYPDRVLRLARAGAVKIVLWHEPDRAAETAAAGGALQLSGHTHGGQVVVPGWGPPLLPAGGRKYPAGRFTVGPARMPLYVSRGVGLLPPMVRLNCPPEVTLITLRRRTA